MIHIDLNNPINVHFTGIGGISMSGFAELLLSKGFRVTGSDRKTSDICKALEDKGAVIYYGEQRAANVAADTDLLVFTAAVHPDNPELVFARENGIPCIERGKLAGDVMLHYKRNFSVAGTHGKTTVTSMLASILIEAGLDPTVSVGGVIPSIGGNMRIGNGGDMVIESCEYTDSFLNFHPTHAIITNIEAEHLDYFKTFERMQESFVRFAQLLPADGLLVYNKEIADAEKIFSQVKCPMITYSVKDATADFYGTDISYDNMGRPSFTLFNKGVKLGIVSLKVIGEHNVANACGAIGMAVSSGIAFDTAAKAVEAYTGTGRRFEKKGEIGGVTIIDDYAHHPTEIKATLEAALRYPHKKLCVVFQPHTYSRTAQFCDRIAEALSLADLVVLTDIYAARETNTFNISSEDVLNILQAKYGKESYHFSSFDEIETFLLENCSTDDLLITMGAGDVVKIGESLLGH
ncbi:MAG: UDP-N-acetylmuramate--L-alanine ligase [Lachnospiraceae bacterium]|nr:UDP-N-acetylmuramate--L-alanine ligase [Lachnospiraceae bacterium]